MLHLTSPLERAGDQHILDRNIPPFLPLLVLVAFALILPGCVTPSPAPQPEAHGVTSATLEGFEPPSFACNQEVDPLICRTSGAGMPPLTLIVPQQERNERLTVEAVPLMEREGILEARAEFTITRLFTNFEIKEAESGKIVSDFNPPILLVLEYTEEEWQAAYDPDRDHPRLAYLVWKGEQWSQGWTEITEDDVLASLSPDEDKGSLLELIGRTGQEEAYPDDSGYLILEIEDWGDPLIGGL